MRLKIITEIIFIIPLIVTIWTGLYVYAGIIALSITTAILYHLHEEKRFLWSDVVASLTLITTNLYYIYL